MARFSLETASIDFEAMLEGCAGVVLGPDFEMEDD